MIRIKRIYDDASPNDGWRVLVDGLWPRGLSKERAAIDEWYKLVAPSASLRKWFNHEESKWDEFLVRYHEELNGLDGDAKEQLNGLMLRARSETVTLLFAAKDRDHCNARALMIFLESYWANHKLGH